MNKQYNLFLDDVRMPKDVTWIELPLLEWVIVRNYKEFIDCITKYKLPSICSFDHDLGNEHYEEFFRAKETDNTIRYNNFKEKTGYDAAKWLCNYCLDKNINIPEYYIHTLNPIGGTNIYSILESTKKHMAENKG